LHDWAYCELADLDAAEYDQDRSGTWTRGLLIRRNIADGDLALFSTWCPAGTPIETLVRVEGYRWAIEDSFETAKNEFGLDHNETRSWHGWYRHVSLVMLTFAILAVIRYRTNSAASPKMNPRKTLRQHRRVTRSAGPCRRSGASPAVRRAYTSSPLTSLHGHCGDAHIRPQQARSSHG
jgi:SRSO17 transposase